MLRGIVSFRATVIGNSVTFPLVELNPNTPGIENIEMKCPNGGELTVTVHFSSIETRENGDKVAEELVTAILNKFSYLHSLAIGKEQLIDVNLLPLEAASSSHVISPS